MKLNCKVKAPASFIYKQLIKSSINDIKGATGKVLTVDELEGFQYDKVFSSKHHGTVTILSVVENEQYCFRTKTKIRDFETSYTLKATGDHSCEVVVEERVLTKGLMLKYNDILMEIISGRARKRQFKMNLEALASSYSQKDA